MSLYSRPFLSRARASGPQRASNSPPIGPEWGHNILDDDGRPAQARRRHNGPRRRPSTESRGFREGADQGRKQGQIGRKRASTGRGERPEERRSADGARRRSCTRAVRRKDPGALPMPCAAKGCGGRDDTTVPKPTLAVRCRRRGINPRSRPTRAAPGTGATAGPGSHRSFASGRFHCTRRWRAAGGVRRCRRAWPSALRAARAHCP